MAMELTVNVETTSNILRKLTIKVPAKIVTSRFEKGLQEVARTAKLKGFRPGHVPMTIVKQYYGADVRHQVFHNLIDESYREALQKEKIKAVGSPKIETPEHQTGAGAHDHDLKEGQDLTFTATVEVMPEIEVKDYTGVALTQGKDEVTADDIEKTLNGFLDSQAQLEPVTDKEHKVVKGNFVDMTFKGGLVTDKGLDERPGMSGTRMLEVGSDQLIAGFEDNLVGMKAGETKTFRVPFPADYFEKDLAGKESEFTVTVNDVKAKKLPTLDDELAKQMGFESVTDMRTKATEHLTEQRKSEVDRKLRSDLLQALIDKNTFDVPASLVMAQTRALAQEVGGNLKQQGFTDQMIQEALGAEIDNLKKRAENQVRASLILESIAKKEKIEVKAEEMDAEIKKMAESMKVEEDKVRDYYNQPGRKDDLEFRLREEHTMKLLLDKAKIKKEK